MGRSTGQWLYRTKRWVRGAGVWGVAIGLTGRRGEVWLAGGEKEICF